MMIARTKSLLGNKGANLVTMTKLDLPVPPGFVISVQGYNEYKKTGRLSEKEITQAVAALEKEAHAKLGKGLQVSVRSSAAGIHARHDGYCAQYKRAF